MAADKFSALLEGLEGNGLVLEELEAREVSKENKADPKKSNKAKIEKESDLNRLRVRQRQIDIGKGTRGYENFVKKFPVYFAVDYNSLIETDRKHMRPKEGPWTPRKEQVCSKRSWDGQMSKWRRLLHAFDDTDNYGIDMEIDPEALPF